MTNDLLPITHYRKLSDFVLTLILMNPEIAPWRSLIAGALHRHRSLPQSRYLQLATVRPDGRPANRTVVFRGFLEGSDRLQIVTDDRSEKVAQIRDNAWGEVCWYFPQTREQFRLSGQLTVVGADCNDADLQLARRQAWSKLSDSARSGFAWPPPGQPRAEAAAFNVPIPDANVPLPQFCLLLLDPQEVDHLQLRGDPQNRWVYRRQSDGSWSVALVNP
ncbi:MAG TPA: pyridoxamine 5'-phosphate oxidase family protein [Oscillatoriales cyanobacterium M59_W2019_021]|nr:MAG: pyridoxamine 5'-phosphate oxidase [Cyanobacteria bacterium J055]HIK32376.1 pyridoxamine 5'-phosphate oxidase family protein [Oscillatoriales cyanobacterium M4454_W2019_049]HIK52740.1 pyridoxamine 5'-phosphate oxidase family protein [Oscillatoriales cyanobacterium M59_W2019_021]